MLWLAAMALCAGMRCEPERASSVPREAAEAPAASKAAVPVSEIASIVAGEVSVVPAARLAVACTALADWREGVSLSRWHGRRDPRVADYAAVEGAIAGDCRRYPRFRFVGNGQDWETWRRLGMVEGEPPYRWERGGWIVVATP